MSREPLKGYAMASSVSEMVQVFYFALDVVVDAEAASTSEAL